MKVKYNDKVKVVRSGFLDNTVWIDLTRADGGEVSFGVTEDQALRLANKLTKAVFE